MKWYVHRIDTNEELGNVTANTHEEAEDLARLRFGHLAPNGIVVIDENFYNEMKRG